MEGEVDGAKLFGKWAYDEVTVEDICFKEYIALSDKAQVYLPHTAGRYQAKRFRKALCPIVERLVGCMQYHGRNTGKKVKAIRIVKHAFEIIHLLTGKNPILVLVNAIMNCGAREDATRIGSGGVIRKQAVDVSPMRRVSQGIYLIAIGTRNKAFRSFKTIAECLAD
jgi:small subunit ribosomal protein S5e